MLQEDRSVILRKFALWAELSHEEYEELQVEDNFKQAKEGEFIYFEAFQHNSIYFIKTGNIRLGYLDADGNRIIKDILKPGDFFGQISLEANSLNGEFAQAMKSDVSLCSFNVANFNNLLKKRPKLAISYSKLIGLRMKRFENRLINILQKDTRTRLILFLEQLLSDSKNPRHISSREIHIPNYLTHDEIAQLIGSSRQTVTTLLNELKEEGKIIYNRKELAFFDRQSS